MKERMLMLLASFFISWSLAMAQTVTVTGVVTSADDSEPVIGASVLVKGTNTGTITGIMGDFTIPNVPSSATTLIISYVGMVSQEVTIQPGTLQVVLKSDAKTLDEVVVTAMGISREKKALGYALQEVKSDEITQAGQLNVANSLSGKVAGIQITSQGGQVGASQNIVIRGNSSFGDNSPLIVVDGVPIQNDNGTGSAVNLGSGLNDIQPRRHRLNLRVERRFGCPLWYACR